MDEQLTNKLIGSEDYVIFLLGAIACIYIMERLLKLFQKHFGGQVKAPAIDKCATQNVKALDRKMDKILTGVDLLVDMHNVRNEDGVYKWWLPSGLGDKIDALTTATNKHAIYLESMLKELERSNDLAEQKIENIKLLKGIVNGDNLT